MYRAILLIEPPLTEADVSEDLEAVGINILKVVSEPESLPQEAVRATPDLVIAFSLRPTNELFKAAATLNIVAPCPMVLFTSDADSSRILQASTSGIHSYVVDGYARHRIPSIIHIAKTRFRREQMLNEEHTGLARRFEERKIVDRAKGLLMRSHGIHEDEAFEMLRKLAMSSRQRIGTVAQTVIDMSRAGEVLNRGGQLRMLSQRIVKCYVQVVLNCDAPTAQSNLADCTERVEGNLRLLERAISAPGYSELVAMVSEDWHEFRTMALATPQAKEVRSLDEAGEKMLRNADNLTRFLETAGLTSSLPIVNMAGRQRMYSQRISKYCCLALMEADDRHAQALATLTRSIEEGFSYLEDAPLSSAAIRRNLAMSRVEWQKLAGLLRSGSSVEVLKSIIEIGDSLLEKCEHLTEEYEKAIQIVVGNQMGRFAPPPKKQSGDTPF